MMYDPQLIFDWYTAVHPKVEKVKPINKLAFLNLIVMHICYDEKTVKLSDYAYRFGMDAYEARKQFKPFVDAGFIAETEEADDSHGKEIVYSISDKTYELAAKWDGDKK